MLLKNLKNLSKVKTSYWLLLIVAFGFLLRVINLTIGFPILYISGDEAIYHLSALNMLAQKTPFTIGNYGPLGAYLQIPFLILSFLIFLLTGKVNSVSEFEFLTVTHEGYFLFIPRIISAMFGTLTILAIYRLARELFGDRRIALCSAFLAALSFNFVHVSHLARAWSPAIFFAMIATYFAVKSVKNKDSFYKYATYSFIAGAIAFGFHQIGGLIFLLIFMILFSERRKYYDNWLKTAIMLLIGLTLLFIFNFLSLGYDFLNIFNPRNESLELIRSPFDKNFQFNLLNFLKQNQFSIFTKRLILTDFIIILLVFLFFMFHRKRIRNYLPFLIFIFINFLLSIFIFPPLIRYFLIAFSLFPVFAGYSFYQLLTITKHKFFLSLALLIFVSFNSIYFITIITREATFTQLRNWLDENISRDEPILATTYRNIGYVPNTYATVLIKENKPGYYLRASNLISDYTPDNVRTIIYVNELVKKGSSAEMNILRALKFYNSEIIIDQYYAEGDRLINNTKELNLKIIKHFSPTGDKIYNESIPEALYDSSYLFPPFRLKRAGPYFDVLKVKRY